MKKKIKLKNLKKIVIINYSMLNTFMIFYYETEDFFETKEKLKIISDFLNQFPKKEKNIDGTRITINNPKNITINFKIYIFHMKKKIYLIILILLYPQNNH